MVGKTGYQNRVTTRVKAADVRTSQWRLLKRTYRKEGELVQETLGWTVSGRHCRGRPRQTWLNIMMREAGKECWNSQHWWRVFTEALSIPHAATGID